MKPGALAQASVTTRSERSLSAERSREKPGASADLAEIVPLGQERRDHRADRVMRPNRLCALERDPADRNQRYRRAASAQLACARPSSPTIRSGFSFDVVPKTGPNATVVGTRGERVLELHEIVSRHPDLEPGSESAHLRERSVWPT